MSVPIATLRDDFADNSQAAAWSESYVTGSATKAESGGQAVFTLPNLTGGTHEAAYKSAATYDLTGDGAYINIGTMVATGVAATAFFDLVKDASNYYRWRQVSNAITARKVVAGVETQLYTATWSATTYKYLRIRESGGTVYFDSSSNGTSWTNRATSTLSGDFAITDLAVAFGASCANIASPGSFRLDDFNLLSLTTNWRWVQGRREYAHRIGSITIAASGGVGYVAVAQSVDASGNLVSPRYFAGPQDGGRVLTEQASQAAAQAMAVSLPTSGRWDLPGFVEGRYVRLYLRSHNGSSFTLREYYPRRYIQADDIEAESIRALHIAAAAVTADKLSVLQLSAITADMGSLTAGTITGATIRTAASGARVELSGAASGGLIGYGGSDTYNPATGAGTYQVFWSKADGKLRWANGVGVMDSAGVALTMPASEQDTAAYAFAASGTVVAGLYGTTSASANEIVGRVKSVTGKEGRITLAAACPTGQLAQVNLQAIYGLTSASMTIKSDSTGPQIILGSPIYATSTTGGLNVGLGNSGAGAGQISALVSGGRVADLRTTNAAAVFYVDDATPTFTGSADCATLSGTRLGGGNTVKLRLAAQSAIEFAIDANTVLMHLTSGGYLRVGDTTAPSYRVELPNTASAAGQGRANAWVTYSSRVRKSAIRDVAGAVQVAKQLRPRRFRWRDDGSDDIGFIAEEVQAVFPEAVTDADGTPEGLGLKEGRISALLFAAFREVVDRLEALEARAATP